MVLTITRLKYKGEAKKKKKKKKKKRKERAFCITRVPPPYSLMCSFITSKSGLRHAELQNPNRFPLNSFRFKVLFFLLFLFNILLFKENF